MKVISETRHIELNVSSFLPGFSHEYGLKKSQNFLLKSCGGSEGVKDLEEKYPGESFLVT